MDNTEKYTDRDWEILASQISGETAETADELGRFRDDDNYSTEKQWNKIGIMGNKNRIDVDKAWNNVYSRMKENGLLSETVKIDTRNNLKTFIRIAAVALIIIGFGTTMFYLNRSNDLSGKIVIASGTNERNKEVSLPDGSKIYLNRNSELLYNKDLGKTARKVTLKGEAFFEITKDPSKPFIIDAGKASIKVLGTSFSVLTNNSKNAVEVFVRTGTVMVSDNSGTQNLVLEPGFTDLLVYDGKTMNEVFTDLKKVYDIDVVADNIEILDVPITTTFYNQPQDSIIQVICATFNFSYKKEGSVYHLSTK
jgi:transmembrane sensor